MKKQKLMSLLRGKGFYVSLGIGAIALAAIGSISYSKLGGNQSKPSPNQQSQPIQEVAVEEEEEEVITNHDLSNQIIVTQEPVADQDLELLVEEEKVKETITKEETVSKKEPQEVEETIPVINTASKTQNIHFNQEKGLLWPITGNVIMNYSMDSTIYFQTLAQYKCNPALIIAGEVGREVFCAADGIVTEIINNEETGMTVTTNIGDGYYIVYGQLKDLTVEVGDNIAEGNVLGTIEKPTKYYVVEGSNLYFQVLEGEDAINPLLFLR